MSSFGESLEQFSRLDQVVVLICSRRPCSIFAMERMVYMQRPGKTFIFELWSKFEGRNLAAIYTVPTRALANDNFRSGVPVAGTSASPPGTSPKTLTHRSPLPRLRLRKPTDQWRRPQAVGHRRIPDARRCRPWPELRVGDRDGAAPNPAAHAQRQRGQSQARGRLSATWP